MEKNHLFKYISRKDIEEMLRAFNEVTGLTVRLTGEKGEDLLLFGQFYDYCTEFHRHNKNGRTCAQEHAHAASMSMGFGQAYIFACHSGLNHIVYPTVIKGKLFGSVIAGPFLMEKPDAALIREVTSGNQIPADGLARLTVYSRKIPVFTPDRVTQISSLFRFLMRSILVESRDMILSNKEKMLQQSRINESIQMYKNSGVRDERSYPVELENELISCIKINHASKAREILNTLLGHILLYEGHDTDKIKIRIIELCSLLSRAAINRGTDANMVLNLNQRLITAIAGAGNVYDICYTLQDNIEIFTDNLFLNTDKNNRIVKSAAEYIAHHFSEDITLASVAEELHINASYLSMLFRQVTGVTFKEHLNRIRVEEAERLLSNTDYAIIEIAIACGYRDQSYFTKVFKKYTGLTPRQYR